LTPFANRTRGVFHCFSESVEAMQKVFALGSLVSFTGIVTFKNGGNVRQALAAAAPGQFMFETDCPFSRRCPIGANDANPLTSAKSPSMQPLSRIVPRKN